MPLSLTFLPDFAVPLSLRVSRNPSLVVVVVGVGAVLVSWSSSSSLHYSHPEQCRLSAECEMLSPLRPALSPLEHACLDMRERAAPESACVAPALCAHPTIGRCRPPSAASLLCRRASVCGIGVASTSSSIKVETDRARRRSISRPNGRLALALVCRTVAAL